MEPQTLQIRTAQSTDFDALMVFYDAMCEVLGKREFLPEGNRGGFPSRAMVRAAIDAHQQLIGTVGGEIAAACILSHDCDSAYGAVMWPSGASEEEALVLHALRVLPAYSRRGFSRQMVEYAMETARKKGARALRLDVLEGNTVPERMYRGYGFVYVDTVQITYEDIGFPMPFRLFEYRY